jgi:hypothetical protein
MNDIVELLRSNGCDERILELVRSDSHAHHWIGSPIDFHAIGDEADVTTTDTAVYVTEIVAGKST